MKRKYITAALVAVTTFVAVLFGLPLAAQAQGTAGSTSLIPNFIQDIFETASDDPANYVTARIRLGIIIALGVVILIAVIFSIMAAIKYISSQGEEGKVAEAKKSVQSILLGIAVLFIAIVGIALVLVFFNVNTPVTNVYNFCITNPDSSLCQVCTNGSTANDPRCQSSCSAVDNDNDFGPGTDPGANLVSNCGTF